MATIILTGGGTAGHCTPHLAILPYVKNDFDKVYYIGSENGIERKIIESSGIPYFSIPCAKLVRKFTPTNLKIPFTVLSGIIRAEKILNELKPDVVFSKGGYVALPVVIAAKNKHIPVIAHESDYTIGLANKITSNKCKKVLTSFPDTASKLKNGEFVGSPIRRITLNKNKSQDYKRFNLSGKKPVLLVTGGSQGANAINKILASSLPHLINKYDVIHLCGKGNLSNQKIDGYYQAEYINDIDNAYSIADVCVTRGGANTLFELLSNKIPCLVIPLPKGISRGDQILNAQYFQKKGMVSVLDQNVLTKESLIYNVNALYNNKTNVIENIAKYPVNDASRHISRIIADCYKK